MRSVASAEGSAQGLMERPSALAIHPRHQYAYAGVADGALYPMVLVVVWRRQRRQVRDATGHAAHGRGAFPRRRHLSFSCGAEAGVWVWDAQTLVLLQVLQPSLRVEAMVLLPRGPAEIAFVGSLTDESGGASAVTGAATTAASAALLPSPLKKYAKVAAKETDGGERAHDGVRAV